MKPATRRPRFVFEDDESIAIPRAAVLVAIGLAAGFLGAALWFQSRDRERAGGAVPSSGLILTDPLSIEFARCLALGEAGARDDACLRAWADNRRRFLTPNARPLAADPIEPALPSKSQERVPDPMLDPPSGDRSKGP